MTITKKDPDSEQELTNLKFDLRELMIAWRNVYPDDEPYDEYKQGVQSTLRACADELEQLVGGAQ